MIAMRLEKPNWRQGKMFELGSARERQARNSRQNPPPLLHPKILPLSSEELEGRHAPVILGVRVSRTTYRILKYKAMYYLLIHMQFTCIFGSKFC